MLKLSKPSLSGFCMAVVMGVYSLSLNAATVGAQQGACSAVVPTRLAVGMPGAVTTTLPGQTALPVRVRTVAGLGGPILLQLRDGDLFTVVGGPVCKDGYLWWQIRVGSGATGWLAEGDTNNYFVQPLTGAPGQTAVNPTVPPPSTLILPVAPGTQTNAVVIDHSVTAVVAAYAPGATTRAIINQRVSSLTYNNFAEFAISRDGSLGAWYAISGANAKSLNYDFIGGGGVSGKVPVPTGYDVSDVSFSPDSRLMGYVFISGQDSNWILGVMDVNNKQRLEFSGPYNKINGVMPRIGFDGVANILGWRPDNSGVILSG